MRPPAPSDGPPSTARPHRRHVQRSRPSPETCMTYCRLLTFVLSVALSVSLSAQASSPDVLVPAGVLRRLEVDVTEGRSLALSRVIRIVHSLELKEGFLPPSVVDAQRTLADIDRIE